MTGSWPDSEPRWLWWAVAAWLALKAWLLLTLI